MIYFVLLSMGVIGAIFYDNGNRKSLNWLYYGLCIANILVFGLRYRVGIDTLNYMLSFESIPLLNQLNIDFFINSTSAPLFIILMSACKNICSDFVLFQFIHNLIINIVFFWFLKRNTINPFLGYVIFFITVGLYFNTEILKESLAICSFLIGTQFFNKSKGNNYFFYFIFAFIAIMFHYGAAILLVVPLLKHLRFNKIFILVIILFLLTIQTSFTFAINSLPSELLQERAAAYEGMVKNGILNINYIFFASLKFIITPIIIFTACKKLFDIDEHTESMVCSFILMGVGCISYQVMFQRFTNYFYLYYIALICNFFTISRRYSQIQNLIIFSLILTTSIFGYISANRFLIWYPYHSIFDPIAEPLRELMWTPYKL